MVIASFRGNPRILNIIAEGSGGSPTVDCFDSLGYDKLAKKFNIELVDLNGARMITKKNPDFLGHAEIQFPKIIENAYLISIPTLKEHTMATVTLSLKNMIGLYPARVYGGGGFGGSWKSKVKNRDSDLFFDNLVHTVWNIEVLARDADEEVPSWGGRNAIKN